MTTPAALPQCPVAVTVNVDVEWGDIAAAGAAGLFGKYSYGRYGMREGFWRLAEVLRVEGVKATFFVTADDAVRHPDLVEAILAGGHEVAALGKILKAPDAEGAGDLGAIDTAKDAIQNIAGAAPKGWRSSNGLITPDALHRLAAQGYTYDSNFENDDRPYVFDDGKGARLAELPVFTYLTDATFYGGFHSPDRARKAWLEEFDALHGVGGYVNLTLNLHGHAGSARQVRANVVADVLNAIGRRAGTGFLRCDELAAMLLAKRASTEPFPTDHPVPITLS